MAELLGGNRAAQEEPCLIELSPGSVYGTGPPAHGGAPPGAAGPTRGFPTQRHQGTAGCADPDLAPERPGAAGGRAPGRKRGPASPPGALRAASPGRERDADGAIRAAGAGGGRGLGRGAADPPRAAGSGGGGGGEEREAGGGRC